MGDFNCDCGGCGGCSDCGTCGDCGCDCCNGGDCEVCDVFKCGCETIPSTWMLACCGCIACIAIVIVLIALIPSIFGESESSSTQSSDDGLAQLMSPTMIPSMRPTLEFEWREEECLVTAISTESCESSILGSDGDFFEYTLRSTNCSSIASAECIYDDSNGKTDCESYGDYNVGDTRPCWVYYERNQCISCNCKYCDDYDAGHNDFTRNPTKFPSNFPTASPTKGPTDNPTFNPSKMPTFVPTNYPSNIPTSYPSNIPTAVSNNPSMLPSGSPTQDPSNAPTLSTNTPTFHPSDNPTLVTLSPTNNPSINPTMGPTKIPTTAPTKYPTKTPTTKTPTKAPTFAPEWKAESCKVKSVQVTDCPGFGTGDWYKYTLEPSNCQNGAPSQCIYDDSNGNTDCEAWGDYDVGDSRDCWVYYVNNQCTKCDCSNCDDNGRGGSP